jgi:hypothetical protein
MTQPEATQQHLPMLSLIPKPVEVDMAVVRRCESRNQAMAMCFNLSGYTLETVAETLGINKGTMSKVVRGKAPLPLRVTLLDYMRACGNLLPLQWLTWKAGYQLVDSAIIESLRSAA